MILGSFATRGGTNKKDHMEQKYPMNTSLLILSNSDSQPRCLSRVKGATHNINTGQVCAHLSKIDKIKVETSIKMESITSKTLTCHSLSKFFAMEELLYYFFIIKNE